MKRYSYYIIPLLQQVYNNLLHKSAALLFCGASAAYTGKNLFKTVGEELALPAKRPSEEFFCPGPFERANYETAKADLFRSAFAVYLCCHVSSTARSSRSVFSGAASFDTV